jgi:hypothetical protein
MSEKIVPIDRSQLPRVDTYKWQEAQKIPIITGFFVEDVTTVELAPVGFEGRAGSLRQP